MALQRQYDEYTARLNKGAERARVQIEDEDEVGKGGDSGREFGEWESAGGDDVGRGGSVGTDVVENEIGSISKIHEIRTKFNEAMARRRMVRRDEDDNREDMNEEHAGLRGFLQEEMAAKPMAHAEDQKESTVGIVDDDNVANPIDDKSAENQSEDKNSGNDERSNDGDDGEKDNQSAGSRDHDKREKGGDDTYEEEIEVRIDEEDSDVKEFGEERDDNDENDSNESDDHVYDGDEVAGYEYDGDADDEDEDNDDEEMDDNGTNNNDENNVSIRHKQQNNEQPPPLQPLNSQPQNKPQPSEPSTTQNNHAVLQTTTETAAPSKAKPMGQDMTPVKDDEKVRRPRNRRLKMYGVHKDNGKKGLRRAR